MHNHKWSTGLFSVITTEAVWDFLNELSRHGPSWEVVPPLLLSCAALIGALRSFLDGAQARRIAREEHKLRDCFRPLPKTPPGLDPRLN